MKEPVYGETVGAPKTLELLYQPRCDDLRFIRLTTAPIRRQKNAIVSFTNGTTYRLHGAHRWSAYPLLNATRCKSSTKERNAAAQVEWEPAPEDQQHREVFGYYVLESLARRVTTLEMNAARNENLRHA